MVAKGRALDSDLGLRILPLTCCVTLGKWLGFSDPPALFQRVYVRMKWEYRDLMDTQPCGYRHNFFMSLSLTVVTAGVRKSGTRPGLALLVHCGMKCKWNPNAMQIRQTLSY